MEMKALEELDKIGIKSEKSLRFYRGRGCPNCFNTGYHGRIAVFETLPINRDIRSMISERKARAEIEAALRAAETGFVSLRENAVRLANA